MRIGIDFDNTIICYDEVFCYLAQLWRWIPANWQGNKHQVRSIIQALPNGDTQWQRLQGKVYGEFIHKAKIFPGFKEFIAACNTQPQIEVFIVSHKTEFGHFDEKEISLRSAAWDWLNQHEFFTSKSLASIKKAHVFFEASREEKIARIKSLHCTHFIDDLPEVLEDPLFPSDINRILFQPKAPSNLSTFKHNLLTLSSWNDIHHAFFSN